MIFLKRSEILQAEILAEILDQTEGELQWDCVQGSAHGTSVGYRAPVRAAQGTVS